MQFSEFNMNVDSMICFRIAKIHQLFNSFYRTPLKKFHLTYVQYVVLMALWQKDDVPVKDLSKRVGISNGTLTPLLKRLQHQGWVIRHRNPNDERQVIVALTKKGVESHNQVLESTQNCFVNLGLSKKQYRRDMSDMKDLGNRIKKVMKKLSKKPKIS